MSAGERPWTTLHEVEALNAIARTALELARRGELDRAACVVGDASRSASSPEALRGGLAVAYPRNMVRVDAIIADVLALAEGRRVRETETRFAVRRNDGLVPVAFRERSLANDYATSSQRPPGYTYEVRVVKVTRIRRAP